MIAIAFLAAANVVGGCHSAGWMLQSGRIDAHRQLAGVDGVPIDVWVIKAKAGSHLAEGNVPPTAILLHPWLTDKTWLLPLGERLAREGWNVVLPDLRHHGSSGGPSVTWGAKEKGDIKKAVDALIKENLVGPEVFVMGTSLGGCVAVQYAAIDPRCRGVIAVAPPTGLKGFVELSTLGGPGAKEQRLAHYAQEGGFNPDDADAIAAARQCTAPLLMVYGTFDTTVPYRQVRQIYEAWAGPKEIEALTGDHATIQVWHNDYYIRQMARLRGMSQR